MDVDLDTEILFAPIDIPSADAEESNEDGDKVDAFSQIAVFIVDANCLLKDERTYEAIRNALLNKILDLGLHSKLNKAGVVFYGTEVSKGHNEGDQGRPETTWFMSVAPPQIHKVQELACTTLEEMRDICGGATDRATATEALGNICEDALMQVKQAKGKTKALATFVFITDDPSPLPATLKADQTAKWDSRVKNIKRTGYTLVAPVTASAGAFWSDTPSIWTQFDGLHGRGRALADSCITTLQHDLDTLWPVSKGLRPGRVHFKLGSRLMLPMLAVKLAQPAARLPAYKYIDCTTQREITTSTTRHHPTTGAALEPEEILHSALDLTDPSKFSGFPKAFVVPKERAEELVGGLAIPGPHPSITLLKFVSQDTLSLYHQVAGTTFLYVDIRKSVKVEEGDSEEEKTAATTRRAHQKAFLALHNAMEDVAALVTIKSRAASTPRLGLLVPIDDEVGADGSQTQPAGFALHTLPYTDELRFVACTCRALPPAVLPKIPYPRASTSATAAAGALIDALTDSTASRYQFDSPEALYAAATLRTQVLGEEPPNRMAREFNGVRGHMARQALPAAVKEEFLRKVLGGHKIDPGAATAGKKRAVPTMSDADVATHINWKADVAGGNARRHTVDILKQFLRHHKLPTSGKKAELLQRVENKVNSM